MAMPVAICWRGIVPIGFINVYDRVIGFDEVANNAGAFQAKECPLPGVRCPAEIKAFDIRSKISVPGKAAMRSFELVP